MWIIPHLRNVPPASLGSSRFILHTINLLFCWTKPCETYYYEYFCLSGPQSWALALFNSLTRVILFQRLWVLWTLEVQEIHMKLSAPKVKNTLQVMRRRRRDIMQGGGHLVQLWWVCSHRRLRSCDADTKLQRGGLSATVHTPACTREAHTHTHTWWIRNWFSASPLIKKKNTDPKKFFLGESEAAVLPPSSWHTPGSYEGSRYQSHKGQNGKFRRDQLDRIRALHPWRTRSTFQESIWDAAKRIKHRKDRNARFNHGKHRAARMLWQITPSVQQQERRTLHPVTPWKQEDLLVIPRRGKVREATERSIHAGWNTSCGFLISKQASGGQPVEGLLMVVFVSARIGSYLRSEFGLAFSDFFHFNYI